MTQRAKHPADQLEYRVLANLAENHNGNPGLAKQLIDLAASAGCDGVVLPHRRAQSGYTKDALLQPVADGSHEHVTRGDLLQRLELSRDTLKDLRSGCVGRLSFIGAPYDLDALADLEGCDPDAYQVEPPVLGHLPLLAAIAGTGKPVYLVAGRCTEDDVAAAVKMFEGNPVTLLHTVYGPAVSLESTALWFIPLLQQRFGLPVGYLGLDSEIHDAVAALALGARTIEKVFTSDRFLPGPSHASSLDRDQLRDLVRVVQGLAPALAPASKGSPQRLMTQTELASAEEPQACLVAAYDLPAGESLGGAMLSVKLAADGLHPKLAKSLMGRRLAYDLPADSPLTFGFIEA